MAEKVHSVCANAGFLGVMKRFCHWEVLVLYTELVFLQNGDDNAHNTHSAPSKLPALEKAPTTCVAFFFLSCQGNMQISRGNGILPLPYAKFKKVKVFRRKQPLQNKMNLALREAQRGEEGE